MDTRGRPTGPGPGPGRPAASAFPPPPDRRKAARYASGAPGAVGWRREDGALLPVPAAILDVSMGGVALLADAAIPDRGPLYVRVAKGPGTGWVEARPVHVRAEAGGRTAVHLAFADGVGYTIFRAAMPGVALDGPGFRYDVEAVDTRYWR